MGLCHPVPCLCHPVPCVCVSKVSFVGLFCKRDPIFSRLYSTLLRTSHTLCALLYSPPLPFTHTHTHTHAYIRTHTHIHTRTYAQTHAHTQPYTHVITHPYRHTLVVAILAYIQHTQRESVCVHVCMSLSMRGSPRLYYSTQHTKRERERECVCMCVYHSLCVALLASIALLDTPTCTHTLSL